MTTVLWIHGDNLSPTSPVFRAAPDAPAIFVFDDALIADWGIGLKRLAFLYESLLELPVSIRRGDVASQVIQFAQEHQATRILTNESVSPRFKAICKTIGKNLPSGSRLDIVKDTPFVEITQRLDLKRFSRYWQAVKPKLLDDK